ncbi:hypothetical protein SS50377_20061 [Spironucleus salmonicida]|uniref:Uncharacterized protein n=1 Tax=Spironucleus salmonicida TaxID=348837 RepID=V6LXU0_9EUKA|nr:hypothetical protein SS50377_20061 [Spironucleus salmonicida]|eukprot:EST49370.1 Hypothetical protein SS50377_10295 [Spironucleus salmonicida]
MQKPEFDERQWIMITPIVTDTIRYLLHMSDGIIKDSVKIKQHQTELNNSFISDRDMVQNQLLKIITEHGQIHELTQSNASKIQHIYSICNHLEDRMAKSEARIENKLTELTNDLFDILSTRTADMMKLIEIRQAAVQTELQKQAQGMSLFKKDVEEKMKEMKKFTVETKDSLFQSQLVLQQQLGRFEGQTEERLVSLNEKNRIQDIGVQQLVGQFGDQKQISQKIQIEYTQLQNQIQHGKSENSERLKQINNIQKEVSQLDNGFKKVITDLDKVQEQLIDVVENGVFLNNHTQQHIVNDDSDLIINKLSQKLQNNTSSTLIEQEILKQIKVYQKQKKFNSGDNKENEKYKEQLMNQILESKLLNDQLVDEMLKIDFNNQQQVQLLSQNKQRSSSNILSFTEFADENSLQILNQQKEQLQQINQQTESKVKSRYEKLRQKFGSQCTDLQIDYENSVTQDITDSEPSSKRSIIPRNKSEIYQMQLNPGTPRADQGSNFQFAQQSLQKNINSQIQDIMKCLEQQKQQQLNDITDLKTFVEYRIQALILKQLNECGLGDFLQLDLKQMELQGELQEVKQQLHLGEDQEKNFPKLISENNMQNNVFYSSTIQMGQNNSLSFSTDHEIKQNERNVNIKHDIIKIDQNKSNVLSKNFQQSKIYQELRFELLKNLQIENEIVYTKFMKEIQRIDGLMDAQSQEIVNVEERLKKLIKTGNIQGSGTFRRSHMQIQNQQSKGIQISISKPVMMIGYTGD